MTFTLPEPPATVRDPSWAAPLPERLSPSSITRFLACPEQWRRSYLAGEPFKASGAMLIGSADSEAAAYNFRLKAVTHEDAPLDEVQDAARDEFKTRLDQDDVEWSDKEGEKNPSTALDTAIRVVTFNHAAEYPLVVAPTRVEEPVEFQVAGAPLVRAYVDVATPGVVVSRKTAGRAPSGPTRPWMVQSAIESAALGVPTVFHVTTKAAKPRLICPENDGPLYTAFADVEATQRFAANVISTTARSIRALYAEFGSDETWPTTGAGHWGSNPTGGMSVCGTCAFRLSGCPVWS